MENSSESIQVRYVSGILVRDQKYLLSFLSLDRMELLSVHAFGLRLFS